MTPDILTRARSKSPYLLGSSAERMIDELVAEIERLRADGQKRIEENDRILVAHFNLRAEIERLQAETQRALDHHDMRSELYTNDADVAAGMASILRTALEPKP